MELYFRIIFFILGSVMGSFFHVVATRISNDESIVKHIVIYVIRI